MQLSDPMTFEATWRRKARGARQQQRLRGGSGSGGKCNCHKLAQAASKDTLLISGGALRNATRTRIFSIPMCVCEYEYGNMSIEYLNRNMRN